jgi:RNA polymerase sigma-70 factor, ECF subfamily
LADQDWTAERFEAHRAHLRAVAYRFLGSADEAEDAVQESWLRLRAADTSALTNERAWLTTVVARVSLNMLRARRLRREDSAVGPLSDRVLMEISETEPGDRTGRRRARFSRPEA